MDQKLSGRNPLSYLGVNAYSPPEFVIHPRAPTTNDYRDFIIGTIWLDSSKPIPDSNDIYMLVSITRQPASPVSIGTWVSLGGGVFQTLSDDIGTIVHPDAVGDISLVGTAGRVTSTGNVVAHSITLDIAGNIAETFTADDANAAVPVAGNINIFGGNNIYTSVPAVDTVQVSVDGTTDHSLQIGNATGSLDSLGVANDGEIPIGSAGANPNLTTITPGFGINIVNGPGSISIGLDATDRPAFQAYITGGKIGGLTGDGTVAIVPFDAVSVDTPPPGAFNVATYEYVVPVAGFYLITFSCGYYAAALGGLEWCMQIRNNGVAIIAQGGGMPTVNRVPNFVGPNSDIDMFLSGILVCAVGDRITGTIIGSGGAINDGVQGSSGNPGQATTLSGFLIATL